MSDLAIVAPARSDPYLDPASREFGFRARRFRRVAAMIEATVNARGQCDILDLGGTETYWLIGRDLLAAHRGRIRVTLVNPRPSRRSSATFVSLDGDATAPDLLAGKRFDIVHSNSVEHVGSDRAMQAFADNVSRLGRNYYVQTPNFWFPYEPHFRIPGFQYLPETVRREICCAASASASSTWCPTAPRAQAVIDHHRLVTTAQMRAFFPDAAISHEMLFGLKKSILAIRDHGPAESGRRSVAAPPLAADIDDLVGERPPTLVPGE